MKARNLLFLIALTLAGLGTAREVGARIHKDGVECSCCSESAQIQPNSNSSQASNREKSDKPQIQESKPQLQIIRDVYTDKSITGKLYYDTNGDGQFADDELIGYTLEPCWKDNKKGESCIPEGTYPLSNRSSGKFGQHLILGNTGDRDLILMHPGNYPKNTQGCILPGKERGQDYIGQSRETLRKLLKIKKQHDNLYLRIKREGGR